MALSGNGALPRITDKGTEGRIWDALTAGCPCHGTEATVRRRLKAHGGVVITLQCDRCGRSMTGDLTRQHFPFYLDLPAWDALLQDAWRGSPEDEAAHQRRLAEAEAARETRRQDYAEFRRSDEWRGLRLKVLARASYRCEACGDGPSEVVHHLTYEHGVAPPLWNMRAVCRPCHSRLHRAGDPWHDTRLPAAE